MGRTPPTNKAKQRAQEKQNVAAIDPDMDPEMRTTLTQERDRKMAQQQWGQAMQGNPKKKSRRSLGNRIKRKVQSMIGLPMDE